MFADQPAEIFSRIVTSYKLFFRYSFLALCSKRPRECNDLMYSEKCKDFDTKGLKEALWGNSREVVRTLGFRKH